MAESIGKVSQIIGPVVDVEFSGDNNDLPKIYDSLEIKKSDGDADALIDDLVKKGEVSTPKSEISADDKSFEDYKK